MESLVRENRQTSLQCIRQRKVSRLSKLFDRQPDTFHKNTTSLYMLVAAFDYILRRLDTCALVFLIHIFLHVFICKHDANLYWHCTVNMKSVLCVPLFTDAGPHLTGFHSQPWKYKMCISGNSFNKCTRTPTFALVCDTDFLLYYSITCMISIK
jgi:hypothetical protein